MAETFRTTGKLTAENRPDHTGRSEYSPSEARSFLTYCAIFCTGTATKRGFRPRTRRNGPGIILSIDTSVSDPVRVYKDIKTLCSASGSLNMNMNGSVCIHGQDEGDAVIVLVENNHYYLMVPADQLKKKDTSERRLLDIYRRSWQNFYRKHTVKQEIMAAVAEIKTAAELLLSHGITEKEMEQIHIEEREKYLKNCENAG